MSVFYGLVQNGNNDKAKKTASELPHTRESREVIEPIIAKQLNEQELNTQIHLLLLGE